MTDIETLENARKEFEFECKSDMRVATPDYSKHRAAYTAFQIAQTALERIRVLEKETHPTYMVEADGTVVAVDYDKLREALDCAKEFTLDITEVNRGVCDYYTESSGFFADATELRTKIDEAITN